MTIEVERCGTCPWFDVRGRSDEGHWPECRHPTAVVDRPRPTRDLYAEAAPDPATQEVWDTASRRLLLVDRLPAVPPAWCPLRSEPTHVALRVAGDGGRDDRS